MKSYQKITISKGLKETFKDSGKIACRDAEFYTSYFDEQDNMWKKKGFGGSVKCRIVNSAYNIIECKTDSMDEEISSNKFISFKDRVVIFKRNKKEKTEEVLKDSNGVPAAGVYGYDGKGKDKIRYILTDDGKKVLFDDPQINAKIAKIVFIEIDGELYRIILKGLSLYKFVKLQQEVGFSPDKHFDRYFNLKVEIDGVYRNPIFEVTDEQVIGEQKEYEIEYASLKEPSKQNNHTKNNQQDVIAPVHIEENINISKEENKKNVVKKEEKDTIEDELNFDIPEISYESDIKPEELPF